MKINFTYEIFISHTELKQFTYEISFSYVKLHFKLFVRINRNRILAFLQDIDGFVGECEHVGIGNSVCAGIRGINESRVTGGYLTSPKG